MKNTFMGVDAWVKRDRAWTAAGLLAVAALAWLYLVRMPMVGHASMAMAAEASAAPASDAAAPMGMDASDLPD